MIGYIYKFENKINGKIYIGKTKNIKVRNMILLIRGIIAL